MIVKYGMVDCSWWDKFLFAFSTSLFITVLKRMIMSEGNKVEVDKDNNNNNSENNNKYIENSNISSNTDGKEESVKDFIIPSILEKELSPLQMILNCEIILSVLVLVHIGVIILIGLHKLYISSGLNIISKLFSPKIAAKYEKFKKRIENIGNTYLIIIVIINVISILFYIIVLIYANVELSNNIDAYIDVHLDMKKRWYDVIIC